MMFVSLKSNTTDVTSEPGGASSSGAHKVTSGFSEIGAAQSFGVFCSGLFVTLFFFF